MNFSAIARKAVLGLGLLIVATSAHAQATRTWVSGVGDDANPCSRTAPCKTFAGAISKTAARGVISVLDPGGFGAVTITKGITIDGGGIGGSILAASTNGIIVNNTSPTAATDVVRIRNISIDGANTGINGVRHISGGVLILENVKINDFTADGVKFEPVGVSRLSISDSHISNALGSGVHIIPGVAGNAVVSLHNVRLTENGFGIKAEDRTNAMSVQNSMVTSNLNSGVQALSAGGLVNIAVQDSQLTNNGRTNVASAGVKSNGSGATIEIARNLITGNPIGLDVVNSGLITSFGDNNVVFNGTNGSPTSTIPSR